MYNPPETKKLTSLEIFLACPRYYEDMFCLGGVNDQERQTFPPKSIRPVYAFALIKRTLDKDLQAVSVVGG
jgi:hypothetical protein